MTDVRPGAADWLEQQGTELVDFAAGSVHPDGGFAWLGDDGRPVLERPVELWVRRRVNASSR